jgi:hypothetical protein
MIGMNDTALPDTDTRERLMREYAAGRVSWSELRERGFDDHVQVLGGLGELGLRPPMASMEGPNVAARERGRAILRRLLEERRSSRDQGSERL